MLSRSSSRVNPRSSTIAFHVTSSSVRWYLRYPLSYQDVVNLLAERDITVDRSTVYRWVRKFGPGLAKRTEKHLRPASVDWHVEETYIRVGGRWRYLWRAVDANGQIVDFRLTARRDTKAARAFLNKAIERVRLHRPVTIVTDKTQAYRHIDRKWRKNLVDGDHAALRRLSDTAKAFDRYAQARQP